MVVKQAKANFELKKELKAFFASELAEHAAVGMSNGACIELIVDGEKFYFLRAKGKNTLATQVKDGAEVTFWIPRATMHHILEAAALPGAGLATLGILIFDAILSKEEGRGIRFKVHASFLTLWAKGYFSVLKAGGPEVASYLARLGFGGISQIKEILKKIRG